MHTYKWTKLNHPTYFPVMEGRNVAIPCNAVGVEIAYGQSSKPLLDNGRPTKKMQNVYRWNGKTYNA